MFTVCELRCQRHKRSQTDVGYVAEVSRSERRHPILPFSIQPIRRLFCLLKPSISTQSTVQKHRSIVSPCGAHCFVGRPVSSVVDLLWTLENWQSSLRRLAAGRVRPLQSRGRLDGRGNVDFELKSSVFSLLLPSPPTQRAALHSVVGDFFSRRTRVTERWESDLLIRGCQW